MVKRQRWQNIGIEGSCAGIMTPMKASAHIESPTLGANRALDSQPPRLLQQVRELLRVLHYSNRTERGLGGLGIVILLGTGLACFLISTQVRRIFEQEA